MTGSEASEAIERWLAARPQPDGGLDATLVTMRRTLRRLTELSLIRDDSRARQLLDDMARSEDMESLSASLDELGSHIAGKLHGPAQGAEPARTAAQPAPRESRPRGRTLLRL